MRVGAIGYACNSGLGILAKSYYDAKVVTDFFIVEHSRHPTQWDWYPPGTPHCPIRQLDKYGRDLRQFVRGLDVLLCFETPFYWEIVHYARLSGVKTVLMPMYECSLTNPPARFHEYWCPSLLDLRYFADPDDYTDRATPFTAYKGQGGSVARFTPVPVEGVPWRQRTEARVFVHNAGHGGLKGRNGTKELVEALPLVKSPATFLLRSQSRDEWLEEELAKVSSKVDVHYSSGTIRQEDLYTEGDVFIFPEKFNGLSLPLQEARAAGMLVMATDRFPINTWLPNKVRLPFTEAKHAATEGSIATMEWQYANPLILPDDFKKNRIGPPYMEFDEAVISPKDIAEKIDEWYGQDMTAYSQSGREWAETMSWEGLAPKYEALLRELK